MESKCPTAEPPLPPLLWGANAFCFPIELTKVFQKDVFLRTDLRLELSGKYGPQ